MKKTFTAVILATTAALAQGNEARADKGGGFGWTLSDEGVLTVTQEYKWADENEAYPWDEYRDAVTSVVIETGVTRIGKEAFLNCENLTSVSIAEGVTQIGIGSFWSCISLTKVAIPESVTEIGSDAFGYDYELSSVNIPKGVTTIESGVFSNCGISEITIPDGVTTIKDGAFYSCVHLKHINIPKSVTDIGVDAFFFCDALSTSSAQERLPQKSDKTHSLATYALFTFHPDVVRHTKRQTGNVFSRRLRTALSAPAPKPPKAKDGNLPTGS